MNTTTGSKAFLDVFGVFSQDKERARLFSEVKVVRIATNRMHTQIRLYLEFPTLISKRQIRRLETDIKQQYFPGEGVSVIIIERFRLSERFTPEILFDSYKDSILEELEQYNAILFSLFRNAGLDFEPSGDLCISLEDSLIAHKSEPELHHILDTIFCKRCGQEIRIRFTYRKAAASRHLKESSRRIEESVRRISSQYDKAQESEEEEMMLPDEGIRTVEKKPSTRAPRPTSSGNAGGWRSDKAKDGSPRKGRWNGPSRFGRRSNNPNVLFGREIEGRPMPIEEIVDALGEVVIRGEVTDHEMREFAEGRIFFQMTVTDDTDTIHVKLFLNTEEASELEKQLADNPFVLIQGDAAEDRYDKDIVITSVKGIMRSKTFRTERMDNEELRRVELHCHTKMSDMDAVSDVADLIACARKWGHKAIAVTDHGVVSAFPDADHAINGDDDIKVIYGTEAYLVDDTKPLATRSKDQSLSGTFVVFDLETTGLNARKCRIIEIGAVKFEHGQITDRFSEFVNPRVPIPFRITELTGITDDMVADAGFIEEVLPRFRRSAAMRYWWLTMRISTAE